MKTFPVTYKKLLCGHPKDFVGFVQYDNVFGHFWTIVKLLFSHVSVPCQKAFFKCRNKVHRLLKGKDDNLRFHEAAAILEKIEVKNTKRRLRRSIRAWVYDSFWSMRNSHVKSTASARLSTSWMR